MSDQVLQIPTEGPATELDPPPIKCCTRCKRDLALDCFSKCLSSKDGLYWKCRECVKETNALHAEKERLEKRAKSMKRLEKQSLENENWKPVQGHEKYYMVSNLGRLWCFPRRGSVGGLMAPRKSTDGYLRIQLRDAGVKTEYLVHRLVALHFVEGYKDDLVVNHKNHIRDDNRAENLEWVSSKLNNEERLPKERKGTIETRTNKAGEVYYYARFHLHGMAKPIYEKFKSLDEAKKWLLCWRKLNNEYFLPDAKKAALASFEEKRKSD